MKHYLLAKIEVTFKDKQSYPYKDYKEELYRHFDTTKESLKYKDFPNLYDNNNCILIKNLHKDVSICIFEIPNTDLNNKQNCFTFKVLIICETDVLQIEEPIKEVTSCIRKPNHKSRLLIKRSDTEPFLYCPDLSNDYIREESAVPFMVSKPGFSSNEQKRRLTIICSCIMLIILSNLLISIRPDWQEFLNNTIFTIFGLLLSQLADLIINLFKYEVTISNDSVCKTVQTITSTRSEKIIDLYSDSYDSSLQFNSQTDPEKLLSLKNSIHTQIKPN